MDILLLYCKQKTPISRGFIFVLNFQGIGKIDLESPKRTDRFPEDVRRYAEWFGEVIISNFYIPTLRFRSRLL